MMVDWLSLSSGYTLRVPFSLLLVLNGEPAPMHAFSGWILQICSAFVAW